MKKVLLIVSLTLALFSTGFSQADKDQQKPVKLTAEDVIAKHLASIGTPEDIAAAKTRVMVGKGTLSGKVTVTGSLGGPTQIASEGNRFLLAMILNSNSYPYEKVAFDGKSITVGVPDGGRTDLGNFLKQKSSILKQGLFGGTLSAGWPLLDVAGNKVKVSYGGLTEMGGRKFHKLKYTSGVGDLNVALYFDAENFHHVISEYKYSIQPAMKDTITEGARAKTEYYTLTEQFSDYKTVGKLTLPFFYAINTTEQTENNTVSFDWKINLTDFYFNEPLDIGVFKVS
jgi:hypothetical protein